MGDIIWLVGALYNMPTASDGPTTTKDFFQVWRNKMDPLNNYLDEDRWFKFIDKTINQGEGGDQTIDDVSFEMQKNTYYRLTFTLEDAFDTGRRG